MHLNDMAGLLPTLDAEASLELLPLAEGDGGLDHLGPRVRRADLAPRGVRLQHELIPRDGTQHLWPPLVVVVVVFCVVVVVVVDKTRNNGSRTSKVRASKSQ